MNPETLWLYIEASHRATGRLPKLRECVEHFDGKLLNVQMALLQLGPERTEAIRRIGREEREAKTRRRNASDT